MEGSSLSASTGAWGSRMVSPQFSSLSSHFLSFCLFIPCLVVKTSEHFVFKKIYIVFIVNYFQKNDGVDSEGCPPRHQTQDLFSILPLPLPSHSLWAG